MSRPPRQDSRPARTSTRQRNRRPDHEEEQRKEEILAGVQPSQAACRSGHRHGPCRRGCQQSPSPPSSRRTARRASGVPQLRPECQDAWTSLGHRVLGLALRDLARDRGAMEANTIPLIIAGHGARLRRRARDLVRRTAGTRGHPAVSRERASRAPTTPERIEEVAHHYELFDGVSPLTTYTLKQAEGLRARLARCGVAAARVCRDAELASVSRGIRWRDVARGRATRDRVHRGGARQLFELHPVSRERRGGAGAPPRRRARRRRGCIRRRLAHTSRVHRCECGSHPRGADASAGRSARPGAAGLHRPQHSSHDGRTVSVSAPARGDGPSGGGKSCGGGPAETALRGSSRRP